MTGKDWRTAEDVARDLAERDTDVNELHKAVTHLRAYPDGTRFFALLDTMVRDGRYLVRSGQTMDYYRDMREVCGEHLREYRNATGDRAVRLLEILGWAVRLMRYYNTPDGREELRDRPRAEARREGAGQQQSSATPRPVSPIEPPVPRRRSKRELVTVVSAGRRGSAQVRTAQGEEIPCTGFSGYPPEPDDQCRAEVTREDGKAVSAVFKGWE